MADEAEKETVDTPVPAQEEGSTDWKAEARKWEDRAKSNSSKIRELNQKISELDGSKSELDKALDRIARLEAKNAELELSRVVAEVAAAKNVAPELLKGSTRQELEESADLLLAWRGEQPKKAAAPMLGRQPQTPEESDAQKVLRQLQQ